MPKVPPLRSANHSPARPEPLVKPKTKKLKAVGGDETIALPTAPNVPSDNLLDYNWMLYGVKNIGKTCLSAMFDDVSAHFLAEPGRRDVATPIIPQKGEVPLTWSRFKSYLELLLEQSPGRAVLDTVDSIAKLCEQHHARLSNVETLMAMTDNGRAWRQMMDDWHNTWNAILWSGWRITVLSHVRVRDKVRRDIARDDLKKGGKAKEAGIVVAETQPSCSGWAYEWTKEVCSIVGCFTYRRRDRYLYIRGHEEMYASPGGGGVGERHFLDPKTEEPYDAVYMGTSPSQAWINLQAAWNNEVEGLKVSEDNFYKEAGE